MFKLILALACVGAISVAAGSSFAATPIPPVDVYGKLPAIEEVSLSPSGDRYAMIAVVGEERRLVVGRVGGAVEKAVKVGKAKVRAVDWAGDTHLLITESQTVDLGVDFTVDRAELDGVLVMAVPSGKSFWVFDKSSDVGHTVMGEFGAAKIDGHWYGFFGGVTNLLSRSGRWMVDHTYPDLYRVDLDSGEVARKALGSETTDDWLVDQDGQVIARTSYSEDHRAWQVRTGAAGGTVLASGSSPFGGVDLSRGRTAETILIRRPTDKDEKGYTDEEISLASGALAPVANARDINGLYHDRTSGLWIGYTTFDDRTKIKMFDPLVDKRVSAALKAFPNKTVYLESWSNDFSRMIVFTTGEGDAGTYWVVDISTGFADVIGEKYPEVRPEHVGPIRMVSWTAQDGLEIHGVLSLPPGREAKNLPVVVLPHGGPEARDHPVFDWWAQAFASRGYAVLQPNYRGSSGYGVSFRNAGFGQWGRKMQTDVSDGLAELAREGIVDPKRACIVGGSYGGYAALAGVTVQHGIYRCAVSVAGVADLGAFMDYERDRSGTVSSTTRYWDAFMGPGSGFAQISPLKLAAGADAPILLVHGKDDTVVPFDQSTAMQRALAAAHKPVEFVVLPGEDHWLSREATRSLMLKSAVAFVEKYNPSDPTP
jgi:dipeptidyl aminopeptidase/acylaminoacyl peptidase